MARLSAKSYKRRELPDGLEIENHGELVPMAATARLTCAHGEMGGVISDSCSSLPPVGCFFILGYF